MFIKVDLLTLFGWIKVNNIRGVYPEDLLIMDIFLLALINVELPFHNIWYMVFISSAYGILFYVFLSSTNIIRSINLDKYCLL